MRIGLPSGIGDFSWAWSKLCNVANEIEEIQIADGWPHRTTPYVELCCAPHTKVSYGQFTYQQIQMFTKVHSLQNPTWERLYDEFRDYGLVLLEPNLWLEEKGPLSGWMPDLPAQFHYPLKMDRDGLEATLAHLGISISPRTVGISCASYRGSEAWKTWGPDQWVRVLQRIQELGWKPLVVGGFWDDLTTHVARKLKLPDLVGRTSVAEMVALMDILPVYIGYSSGMNVIRTVLRKPVFALWPEHQNMLRWTWAPPDMIRDRTYMCELWADPEIVLPGIEEFLGDREREL